MKDLLSHPKKGFTLIELLIVVAIIGILAAIAVPNFLNAQTRTKLSRVKADIRNIATAIEMYKMDNNEFPWYEGQTNIDRFHSISLRLIPLTTPVSYIGSVNIPDPFLGQIPAKGFDDEVSRYTYNYLNYKINPPDRKFDVWALGSFGPDQTTNKGLMIELAIRNIIPKNAVLLYNPSNGLTSTGDLPYIGGNAKYAPDW
jgi:general secretion pathway protein G